MLLFSGRISPKDVIFTIARIPGAGNSHFFHPGSTRNPRPLKLSSWNRGFFPLIGTPPKINMEPEKQPLEKEKHLQTTNFWGSMLIFMGVSFTKVYRIWMEDVDIPRLVGSLL